MKNINFIIYLTDKKIVLISKLQKAPSSKPLKFYPNLNTMPKVATIIKGLLSLEVLPAFWMIALGTGILPMDDGVAAIAAPFIGPLNIPVAPFLGFLGTCKMFAVASWWGVGPMSEWFGRVGMMTAAGCGAYGHSVVGESAVPPIIFLLMTGGLFLLDDGKKKSN